MPRFRPTEQQTVAAAPRVSSDAFGASAAKAMQQLGGATGDVAQQVAQMELRTRERADVIDRVRQQNAFEQTAISLRRDTLDGADITSPDTVDEFRNNLQKQKDSILAAHNGLPGSKAALRSTLENLQGQYMKQIMGDQIKAQQTMLLESVQSRTNQLASVTAAAPDALEDSLADFDDLITELSPALTGEQEIEYRRQGQEGIILGAVSTYLERGDYQSANAIMNSEQYSQILSPQASRKVRIESAKVQGVQEAEEQAYNDRVAQYTLLTGRNLTPEEKAKIKLLPDKPSEMTPADKISEYVIVTGKPATQAVIDKIHKVQGTGTFGTGLRGKMFEVVNGGVSSYAAGLMNPQEANEFQSAVYELYGVKESKDPVTGKRTQSQPTMPPFVKEALKAGASYYGAVDVGGLAERDGGGSYEPDEFEGQQLWSIAEEVSGPVTGLERAAFGMTGVGDPIQQRAAFTARNLQEKIVAGIRPEGKIANQYRQELMNLVDIQPKLLQNDMAYRYKLADIDQELRGTLRELRGLVDGDKGGTTVQERRDAMTLSHNIEKALVRLGVQRPKTVDEAKMLPSGSYFVDPQGVIRQVPERDRSTGGQSGR